ncbi:MAG: hypothetical protein GF419_14125, partial [Ignavibacteriales bacterium]|nr:hypothetical protein [Ignavibacteriales bacterium]
MKRLLSIVSLAILFSAPTFAGGEPDAPSIVFEEEMSIGYIEMRPQPGVNEGYPSVGDNVTWVAHVWNRTEWWNVRIRYRWYINGVQVNQGNKRIKSYENNNHTTHELEYTTTWTGNDDVITFEIYETNFWPEEEEDNNTISVIATAQPVGAYVEQSFYYHFQENQKFLAGAHSRCFGDWMHRHIDTLNTLMGQAVYTPEAPSGATDRFRLQKVTIVPDGSLPMSGSDAVNYPNPDDTLVDVQLGFTADMVDDYDDYYTTGSYNPFHYDITVLQRILKTRYAIELTAWDVEDNASDRNIQILEDGEYVAGSDLMPWLGAYSDAVHYSDENGVLGDDFSQIAKYTAVTLNLIAGNRATEGNGYPPENLHDYLNDLPSENKLTIHDVDGVPLDYANVQIFQSEGDGSTWYSKSFDNSADMSFTTNASGEALVGMCPFSVDGEVVHEFGRSTTVAIMRIQYDSKVDYQFLESKDFNYEYWAGNTTLGTYDVYTDFKSHDLDVLTPNGGEVWRVGTDMDIVWDGVKVPTAIIEYSTNGGSSWTTITSAGSGATERYTWTIPNEISSNCLIRVIDASDATVGDTSDAAFSIAQASIAVTAPNGGETVTVGDGLDIRWNSSNMPTVNVQISRNNGVSWETVAANVPGDAGSYYWTVSGSATTTALARVADTYDASINDVSDAVFTIQGLSVTPNVWFVDASVGSSGDGTSEATAFKTINEAIQAADPYDTIKVLPGTYTSFESTASRDERLYIMSTGGAAVTTLDGAGVATGRAFRVKAGWTIDGFTFTNFVATTNPNNNAAIKYRNDVDSTAAIVVRNNVFDGNAKIAVGIDGSYAKTIYEHNVFMNGSDRVFKGEWRDVRIYNNVFADNGDGSADYAIYIYNRNQAETRVDIRNNSFVSNDLSGATDGLVKVEPV